MTTPNKAPERAAPPQRGPFNFVSGPPQKSKNFKISARRLIRHLTPDKRGLVGVIALALGSVSLSISGPYLSRHVFNLIMAGYQRRAIDFGALGDILTIIAGLYVGASLLTWLQGYVLNIVVQRRVRALRTEVQAKMNRLPLSYFDLQPRGELLSRVTNDIDNVATSLQQTLSQMLNAALQAIGSLAMLVVISRLLAIIALVTVPLSVIITAKIGKRSQSRFIAQWKHVGALNGQIEEAFTGHALVSVFGRRREIEARFQAKNEELFEASFRAQFISSIIMPSITFVGNLTFVAIAVVGGLRMASGGMSLGDVQAFMQYSRIFTQNLSQLAQVANVLQSGVASAERVFEVLDAVEQSADPAIPSTAGARPRPSAPPDGGAVRSTIPAVRGEVRFEHVGFRYKPEQPLIDDLSLVATPGQTVAIVGPTGAGKTTLVNLIMRFYELDAGRITIDGVDIATMARRELRGEIGMVLQDTWLFGGTIRDNIRYGNPGASEAELIAAAKATYVDRFVHALPQGYDTVLDEAAGNVSAGEKQLITIARAFLADPAILILDEATSSVDTRTEVLVQQAMAALRAKRTSFVIAHRLSTIRDANLILVMEAGRIVEQGTHAELLAARGAYHTLYHAQFAAPAAA